MPETDDGSLPPDPSVKEAGDEADSKKVPAEYYELIADKRFHEFLEAEVIFRVNEQLKARHVMQTAFLGAVLLLACMGLAFAGNAYVRLQDARAKTDELSTTLSTMKAILSVASGSSAARNH